MPLPFCYVHYCWPRGAACIGVSTRLVSEKASHSCALPIAAASLLLRLPDKFCNLFPRRFRNLFLLYATEGGDVNRMK